MKRALIIVDPQYDFMPGGALSVLGGDEIVPPVGRLLCEPWDLVAISQDRHPVDHCSFKENGGDWPAHCIAGTRGAQVHEHIRSGHWPTLHKGTERDKDAYSAFETPHANLATILRIVAIKRVYVCGLATDYCVKATVLDALKAGYETYVVLDACRGVNVRPGDSELAILEMLDAGALATTVGGVLL